MAHARAGGTRATRGPPDAAFPTPAGSRAERDASAAGSARHDPRDRGQRTRHGAAGGGPVRRDAGRRADDRRRDPPRAPPPRPDARPAREPGQPDGERAESDRARRERSFDQLPAAHRAGVRHSHVPVPRGHRSARHRCSPKSSQHDQLPRERHGLRARFGGHDRRVRGSRPDPVGRRRERFATRSRTSARSVRSSFAATCSPKWQVGPTSSIPATASRSTGSCRIAS